MTEAFITGAEWALAVGGFLVSLATLGLVGFGLLVAASIGIDWWVNRPPRRLK